MNHRDAWARLKGYVETREVDATVDYGLTGDRDMLGRSLAFVEITDYMDQVEAEYGLVQEASPNRER